MVEERQPDHIALYQIDVKGEIDEQWSDWFDGFIIHTSGGQSQLTGPVVDQAALHRLLAKLSDLGLPILMVRQIPWGQNRRFGTGKET